MQPDSLLYIYLFLPFCLVVYYLIPQKGKNTGIAAVVSGGLSLPGYCIYPLANRFLPD